MLLHYSYKKKFKKNISIVLEAEISKSLLPSRKFKIAIEKKSDVQIIVIGTDRGIEIISNEFQDFCEENVIRRTLKVPRNLQRTKRKNRTTLDITWSMLKSKILPKEF